MSTLNRPTDPFSHAPPVAGVFVADPTSPPSAPPGAQAVVVKNAKGEIVSFSWRAPEYAGQRYFDEVWEWFEGRRADLTCLLKLVKF